jgi:hypothetical protein
MRKAANVVKAEQKRLLKGHRSEKTGTRELWSDKAKERNSKRVGLWKSIIARVGYDKRTGQIFGSVGPSEMDAWIGWFIQVGREAMWWGRPGDGMTKPYPFVTMAGKNTQAKQQQKIAEHVKKNWEKA